MARKKFTVTVVLHSFCIFSFFIIGCSNGEAERISSHLKYSGYSSPQYNSFKKESQYITVKDGTKLGTDIFLPTNGSKDKKFPTIFIFTPYNRSYLHPKLKWYEKIGARISRGTWGPVFDWSTRDDIKLFLSHGYAIVVADMRGTGASFGKQIPFTPEIADDGVEVINWIAAQSWSNGKVGMMERSYLGWIQLMIAAKQPKALKCIMPEVIASETYTEGLRPGGIDALAWITRYTKLLKDLNLNKLEPDEMSLPVAPVIDEDGDGELADEIPLMDLNNPSTFLDDGEPTYSDKSKRKHIYYNATNSHKKNILFSFFQRKNAPFFDSSIKEILGDMQFIDSSPGYYTPEIIESKIPVYHIGGWFDGFLRGTTRLYGTMHGKTKTRLHIAPRYHYTPFISDAYKDLFGYKEDYKKQLTLERLRFFDYYLKGIDNGFENEHPVNIYVMNSGWRSENEWPLKRQVMTSLYLNNNNKLTSKKSAGGSDRYNVDFSHRSSYGTNNVNRYLMMYLPDELMIRTDQDKKCLSYDTGALKQDMEVTGHPIINLWVSSDQDYGDFYVYLSDVDENGRSLYVTEGKLRAGWADLYNDDDQVMGKIDILPDLPWHGYKKNQFKDRILKNNVKIKLRFDLMPTAWLFKKGHRIRVAIACADNKNYEMNPGLCQENKCPETNIIVYRSSGYESFIEIPVIPADK